MPGGRLARSMVATSEEVADTLEEVAKYRPAADAERLHAEAEFTGQLSLKNAA